MKRNICSFIFSSYYFTCFLLLLVFYLYAIRDNSNTYHKDEGLIRTLYRAGLEVHKDVVLQEDEREYSSWVLNNLKLLQKDNGDELPSESYFNSSEDALRNICNDSDKDKCIVKFKRLETRVRASPKYRVIGCLIQKNMSTVFQAILCLLFDEVKFLSSERSLTRESSNIRLCRHQNEFNAIYLAKNATEDFRPVSPGLAWKYLALTRDPVDRFLSNFIDQCIRKPTGGPNSCNHCRSNMTCFIISEYNHMLHESSIAIMERDFEDVHFFPQNWRCAFDTELSKYSIVKYNNKNIQDLKDTFDAIRSQLNSQYVPNSTLDYIEKEMLGSKTMHTTVDSKARSFFEDRLRSSPFLMEFIVRMYYYDYLLFDYSIPTISFKK